jgi:D-alanine-D-alanine ligase
MNVAAPSAVVISEKRAASSSEFGKVALLYGGLSAEREVSLQSGAAVLAGLREAGVDVHPLDVGEDIFEQLARGRFDRAFNVLHGRGGEDGTIQGALEMAHIPCTGSGVLGSALAMDKQRTKLIWQAVGLPVAPSCPVNSELALAGVAEQIGFPVIVKPVHEGSSIGMAKAKDAEGLLKAWWLASRYDDEIMVEKWIEGTEYTLAIVGRDVLPAIKLETPREFYDYEAKYTDGAGTQYLCPCGLGVDDEAKLASLALCAFDAVGASSWGRIDLICDDQGPWLLEVNTNPGMTSHSLVPMAAANRDWSFSELVVRILETTL